MTVTGQDTGGKHPGWRRQAASILLGAAIGITVNLVSGAIAYWVIPACLALAALLMALNWLRSVPASAPIVRYSIKFILILGFLIIVFADVGPAGLTPYMILAGVGLIGAAVLIPTDSAGRMRILLGVAVVGLGTAFVGNGVSMVVGGELLRGAVDICLGAVGVGVGVDFLVKGRPFPKAGAPTGAAMVVVGVALLQGGNLLGGVGAIGFGMAVVGARVVHLADTDRGNRVKRWLGSLVREHVDPEKSQSTNDQIGEKPGDDLPGKATPS